MHLAYMAVFAVVGAASGAGPTAVPPAVQSALEGALTIREARVEVTSYAPKTPPGCQPERAEVGRPLAGSGRLAVKLTGTGRTGAACTGWAWVGVRVFARVLVSTRNLREGEGLDGATALEEREIAIGQEPLVVATGQTAARAVARGKVIEATFARAIGVKAGEPIKVVVASGALKIQQTGRAIACGRGRTCAVLPSGKLVEGSLVEGQLLVSLP